MKWFSSPLSSQHSLEFVPTLNATLLQNETSYLGFTHPSNSAFWVEDSLSFWLHGKLWGALHHPYHFKPWLESLQEKAPPGDRKLKLAGANRASKLTHPILKRFWGDRHILWESYWTIKSTSMIWLWGTKQRWYTYICVLSWRGQGRSISDIVGLASLTIRAFSVFNVDCRIMTLEKKTWHSSFWCLLHHPIWGHCQRHNGPEGWVLLPK